MAKIKLICKNKKCNQQIKNPKSRYQQYCQECYNEHKNTMVKAKN